MALVVTPIASAQALAQLATMAGIACTVVPTRSGAVAAMHLTAADPFEELAGNAPARPLALAKAISILTRLELLLLVCRFGGGSDAAVAEDAPGVAAPEAGFGAEGRISAWQISGADVMEPVSPGLLLARLDPVIEDLAVGERTLSDFPGALTVDESDTESGG